jgi:hypothetical protein
MEAGGLVFSLLNDECSGNVASGEFIGQDSAEINVDVHEYMQGPGRFISPVSF